MAQNLQQTYSNDPHSLRGIDLAEYDECGNYLDCPSPRHSKFLGCQSLCGLLISSKLLMIGSSKVNVSHDAVCSTMLAFCSSQKNHRSTVQQQWPYTPCTSVKSDFALRHIPYCLIHHNLDHLFELRICLFVFKQFAIQFTSVITCRSVSQFTRFVVILRFIFRHVHLAVK